MQGIDILEVTYLKGKLYDYCSYMTDILKNSCAVRALSARMLFRCMRACVYVCCCSPRAGGGG
jgi:hypothetical protein